MRRAAVALAAALIASPLVAGAQSVPHKRDDGAWVCPNDDSRVIMNGDWRIACYTDTPGTYRREARPETARTDQPPALTIKMVRGYAAAGMAPLIMDVERLSQCPGVRPLDGMTPDEIGQARAARVPPGAYWLRLNDAAIERCLNNTGGSTK
jgi:hypothetical protein